MTMMQPVAVTAAHVTAVRGVEDVLRARRGQYVSAHKLFFDVAGAGTLSMALYRVNGIVRWYESDRDDVLVFGADQSARKLIAFRTSN